MPTLRVENVPEDLYESLRERARANRRSISAETISLLENTLPGAEELQRSAAFYQRIQRLSARKGAVSPGPSAEELVRPDRTR
jgi:plasmid stability protein